MEFLPEWLGEMRLWAKGDMGGKKDLVIPDEVDVVDGGDGVEGLAGGSVNTGSSIVTKPPKPVSSVSALPVQEGIESFWDTRRARRSRYWCCAATAQG